MAVTPKAVVSGPSRTGLPFGLFSVLAFRPEGQGRWQNGFMFQVENCSPALAIPGFSCDPDARNDEEQTDLFEGDSFTAAEANEFTVQGWFDCSPVGISPADAQEYAERHLILNEESRVEETFWTGDMGNKPFLTDSAEADDLGTATKAKAVAALEYWAGAVYGFTPVFHIPRRVASEMLNEGLLEVKGQRLQTKLGTPVVAGTGYADERRIVATGALLGYRSDIFAPANSPEDSFNRKNNDLRYVAERTYALGFDPCGHAMIALSD